MGLGSVSCTVGVETFDGIDAASTFTSDYGTGGVITGTYTGARIEGADAYGGAGGTGHYVAAYGYAPYTIALATTLSSGLNYFGFWLSAVDAGNVVSLYRDGVDIFDLSAADVTAALGSCAGANAYCSNPNAPFAGQNNELYAFVNLTDTSGTFDSVKFQETTSIGGLESDNQTVGYVTRPIDIVVPAPEPGSLSIMGAGLLAAVLVRRRGGLRRSRE